MGLTALQIPQFFSATPITGTQKLEVNFATLALGLLGPSLGASDGVGWVYRNACHPCPGAPAILSTSGGYLVQSVTSVI